MPWALNIIPCRSCRASIFFARTPAGRAIPIDASVGDPDHGANLILEDGLVRVARKDDPPGPRYRSHFVSCPNSSAHRKPRTKTAPAVAGRK